MKDYYTLEQQLKLSNEIRDSQREMIKNLKKLREYAEHMQGCYEFPSAPCTCGLDEIMKGT